ncbi:MAG TPA: helix-turn-helix domain-containing protein, partial [Trueperaceae bacterium]|nr:helix-turn-helix domain-containing protein [Trueperaceae bacterium]
MEQALFPEIPIRSPRQLGQALARMRRLRGSTQVGVAQASGVRQPTISSVESGAPGTELATVFAILAALDLELV